MGQEHLTEQARVLISKITDKEELRRISHFLRDQWRDIDRHATRSFMVGDQVMFRCRWNEHLSGTVDKVNRTTIVVAVPKQAGSVVHMTKWTVPAANVQMQKALMG